MAASAVPSSLEWWSQSYTGLEERAVSQGSDIDVQTNSLWSELAPDLLARVLARSSRLSCVVQHVCKSWRKEALKHPVSLSVDLTSVADRDSLTAWLQHNSFSSASHLQQAGVNRGLQESQAVLTARLDLAFRDQTSSGARAFLTADQECPDVHTMLGHKNPVSAPSDGSVNATKEGAGCCFRQLASLNLSVWATWEIKQGMANWGMGNWVMDMTPELTRQFWNAVQTARVQQLVLGEFPTVAFVREMHYMLVPVLVPNSTIAVAPSLACLEALTLNLTCFSVTDLFYANDEGSMHGFHDLAKLTSLTLTVSEVYPSLHDGERRKHSIPEERLLQSLPDSLCSLSLRNFRERWTCFEDLSRKPRLVTLDLSESNFILPEGFTWTQLQSLTLRGSIVWAAQATSINFQALTQLTSLEMPACQFGISMRGELGNTLEHKVSLLQAPTSIVKLDINSRCIKSFLVKDSLPRLAHLAIHKFCEIIDGRSQLNSLPNLKISFDCCGKSYHGEWFDQISHLAVKCPPNNVPLGVPGYYPCNIESLQLHTQGTDPLTISTGSIKDQPKPYPHLAASRRQRERREGQGSGRGRGRGHLRVQTGLHGWGQGAAQGQGSGQNSGGALIPAHIQGQGQNASPGSVSPAKLLPAKNSFESPYPNLGTLELLITGGIKELVLSGLVNLHTLTVRQTNPPREIRSMARCKHLQLPPSLRNLDLTVNTYLKIQHQLTILCKLPRLQNVGLHGPVLEQIPPLPTTVQKLDLSESWLVDARSYGRLSELTHLQELLLPHPIPDTQEGKALQTHLKKHLVQLQYTDTDPFIGSYCGTRLHPIPIVRPMPMTAAAPSVIISDDAQMGADMQAALLADAAALAQAPPADAADAVGALAL